MTLDEIETFRLACEEYRSVGDDEVAYTLEEVQARWPISEQDACSFAVYAFPVQQWLNFESYLNDVMTHLEAWRSLGRNAQRQLIEQYNLVKDQQEKLESDLSSRK